jgi:protein SCO1/2
MNRVSTDLGRRLTGWLPWTLTVVAAMGLGHVRTVAHVMGQSESDGVVVAHERSIARQSAATAGRTSAQRYFTDVVLLNQNGEQMRFYSDLLRGKVVIINSFFGTCRDSCLPMNRNLEMVQQALGDRVGKDVRIISISVDPTVDTVASLKEYAKTLHAGPGWYFITGAKQNVDAVLRKLGQFVDDKQNHLNLIIVGNERTGLWKKAFGLARSEELVKVVESVLNDKSAGDK